MNKNLDKKLDKIADMLLEMLFTETENLGEEFNKRLKEAKDEKVIISVEKGKNGEAKTTLKGSNLGILYTLAGLEKSILQELHISESTFKIIKDMIGSKEA